MTQENNSTPIIQGMKDFTEGKRIRHCKIIGTIGPASQKEEVLRELISIGMDTARLNFSHGDHETHLRNMTLIRKIAKELGRNVTILQDLQGPKIRCGKLLNGGINLKRGEEYLLEFGIDQTDPKIIPIDYKNLVDDVKVGERVMMNDGLLIFEITAIIGEKVKVTVSEGGKLTNRKGVNFPDSDLSLPALTEKDNLDLLFGITHNVDVIALSFVRKPQDILQCKRIIAALGSDIPVIAKIEKLSAIDNIEEIAKQADGLMVARGDLGVEGNIERVPSFQRAIIASAAKYSKPVIIATQMLESMIESPRASSAEVTDVANGVLEGADCVMLSAEVASGKYPVQAVERMISIINTVESWSLNNPERYSASLKNENSTWEAHSAVARAACEAADSLNAKAIVCLTLTGSIAKLIASWRPATPIIAISPRKDVIQRLGLTWGVYGMHNTLFYDTDILLHDLPQMLKSLKIVKPGDIIVITAGIPIASMSSTNMVKINKIA